MRFIYKVIIGLFIFNAMLVLFDNPLFNLGPSTGADVLNNPNYTPYKTKSLQTILTDFIIVTGGIFGLFIALGTVLSNAPTSQLIGVGSIIAVLGGLWNGVSSTIMTMTNNYPEAQTIYNVLIICIFIITGFGLLEVFTFKGDVE